MDYRLCVLVTIGAMASLLLIVGFFVFVLQEIPRRIARLDDYFELLDRHVQELRRNKK